MDKNVTDYVYLVVAIIGLLVAIATYIRTFHLRSDAKENRDEDLKK
jgi:hypothetical protein